MKKGWVSAIFWKTEKAVSEAKSPEALAEFEEEKEAAENEAIQHLEAANAKITELGGLLEVANAKITESEASIAALEASVTEKDAQILVFKADAEVAATIKAERDTLASQAEAYTAALGGAKPKEGNVGKTAADEQNHAATERIEKLKAEFPRLMKDL